MRIVTRHITNEFLKFFFTTLAAFTAIFLVVDFFEKIDNFVEAGAAFKFVVAYYLYQIPLIVQQILPAATLLGAIITLGLMAKRRELLVLRSSGISLLRITYPLLLVSVCFTIGLFFLNETTLPALHQKANRIWQEQVLKKPITTFFRNEKIWHRGKGIIYHIDYYDADRQTLHGITIYKLSPTFELLERIDARSAKWMGDHWQFEQGIVQAREGNGEYSSRRFDSSAFALVETPDDFKHTVRKPEELTLTELRAYTKKLRLEGYDATRYETDLQGKIAFPFVCVVMTLTGIPIAFRTERKGGIAAGVGMGVMAAFLYFTLYSVSITSGQSGALPPVVAGWLANVVFLTSGVILLATVRQ